MRPNDDPVGTVEMNEQGFEGMRALTPTPPEGVALPTGIAKAIDGIEAAHFTDNLQKKVLARFALEQAIAAELARDTGWQKLITYTLQSESGASLRGAGWKVVAELGANRPAMWQNRPGRDWHPVVGQQKFRWEVAA